MSASTFNLTGNVTRDPELRFTSSGTAVAKIGVAVSTRKLNKATNQWENGDPSFYDLQAWGTLGEETAERLAKGDAIIASGRISQRSYETKEGEKRTVYEFTVDDIGLNLRWAKPKGESRSRNDEAPF